MLVGLWPEEGYKVGKAVRFVVKIPGKGLYGSEQASVWLKVSVFKVSLSPCCITLDSRVSSDDVVRSLYPRF
jgi:hypothetical protein